MRFSPQPPYYQRWDPSLADPVTFKLRRAPETFWQAIWHILLLPERVLRRIFGYIFGAFMVPLWAVAWLRWLRLWFQGIDPTTDLERLFLRQIHKHHSTQAPCPFAVQQSQVRTYDGALLETLEVRPAAPIEADPRRWHYEVRFLGVGCLLEERISISDLVQSAVKAQERQACADDGSVWIREKDTAYIAFNYRGGVPGEWGPCSKRDLVIDGIAQVQRLLDRGVPSHQIQLYGHSYGGGVATLVASYFHRRGMPIYLFNDRSFSRASDVSSAWLRVFPSLDLIYKRGLTWLGWEIDAVDHYQRIPAAYKGAFSVENDVILADATLEQGLVRETGAVCSTHQRVFGTHRNKLSKLRDPVGQTGDILHRFSAFHRRAWRRV